MREAKASASHQALRRIPRPARTADAIRPAAPVTTTVPGSVPLAATLP
ncbi:hypothetical protein [Streptomyces kronopolitis]